MILSENSRCWKTFYLLARFSDKLTKQHGLVAEGHNVDFKRHNSTKIAILIVLGFHMNPQPTYGYVSINYLGKLDVDEHFGGGLTGGGINCPSPWPFILVPVFWGSSWRVCNCGTAANSEPGYSKSSGVAVFLLIWKKFNILWEICLIYYSLVL